MSDKYVLILVSKSTKNEDGEHPTRVLEVGNQARLKTYRNGVEVGLRLAGFKMSKGFHDSGIFTKDGDVLEIILMTNEEWKEY